MPLTSASLSGAGGPGQPAHSRFYEQQGSRWGGVDNGMYGSYCETGAPSGLGSQQQPGQQQQQQQHQSEPLSAHQLHQQQLLAQAQAQQQQAQQRQAQHQASVQQGVSQLQSAAAHTNGATVKVPVGLVVPQGPGTPSGVGDAKAGKGPVEFNHAISYVNKIKVSFPFYVITCSLS